MRVQWPYGLNIRHAKAAIVGDGAPGVVCSDRWLIVGLDDRVRNIYQQDKADMISTKVPIEKESMNTWRT